MLLSAFAYIFCLKGKNDESGLHAFGSQTRVVIRYLKIDKRLQMEVNDSYDFVKARLVS